MTEFKTQVAEALRAIPGKQYSSHAHFAQDSEGERHEWFLQQLAPRVAAAIHDAVEEFARSADDPTNDSATFEQAAVAALSAGVPEP